MRHLLNVAAKFVVSLIVMTIVCTAVWECCVGERLYDCTDAGFLEYMFPGDWVHHPIAVHQVVHHRTMSEPDMIKEGWSISLLWRLWYSFVAVSLLTSILLTRIQWIPSRPREKVQEPTKAV